MMHSAKIWKPRDRPRQSPLTTPDFCHRISGLVRCAYSSAGGCINVTVRLISIPSGVLEAAEEPALFLEVVGQRVDVEVGVRGGLEGDDAERGASENPHPGNLGDAALQERYLGDFL